MYSKFALALGTALLTLVGAAQAQEAVEIGVVVELSGAGPPAGTNWRDGIRIAVDEINAEGGILGKPVNTKSPKG